jgi:hypothetical protein
MSSGNAARLAASPKVGGKRQLHKFNNRPSRVSASQPRRR